MRVAVFTSNQPRHLALLERVSGICDEVFTVQECMTAFPGKVQDFYRKSDTMQRYFGRVIAAEREVFGDLRFLPANVRQLALKTDDLNLLDPGLLLPALQADAIIVFGASFIREPLLSLLVDNRAYNIHMGVSPYYRGSSCNFWAMYDDRPDYVGATIHSVSRGLDAGPILFHAFPEPVAVDPFVYGMRCVRAAQIALCDRLLEGTLSALKPEPQDRSREIRYTRTAEFTDEVAERYLANLPTADYMLRRCATRDMSKFWSAAIVAT